MALDTLVIINYKSRELPWFLEDTRENSMLLVSLNLFCTCITGFVQLFKLQELNALREQNKELEDLAKQLR